MLTRSDHTYLSVELVQCGVSILHLHGAVDSTAGNEFNHKTSQKLTALQSLMITASLNNTLTKPLTHRSRSVLDQQRYVPLLAAPLQPTPYGLPGNQWYVPAEC